MMAAFILPVLFITTSCGDDDDSDKVGWTEANKSDYVNNCVSEGATRKQCECLYNKIARSYTYDEFEDLLALDDMPNEDMSKIFGFISDCGINL